MKAGRGVIKTYDHDDDEAAIIEDSYGLDEIRLAMLKDHAGLITDPLLATAVKLAREMAQAMFEKHNRDAAYEIGRLNKVVNEKRDEIRRLERREGVYRDLVASIAPFFNKIQLGPGDRIASVAIDRGGVIEVVSL